MQASTPFLETDSNHIVQKIHNRLEKLTEKILALRVFPDDNGKMNLSVKDIQGGVYVVSQFTLFGDFKKGNRPSFVNALKPYFAEPIYNQFVKLLQEKSGNLSVFTGIFGAEMQVSLCNDGPVTLIIEA